MDARRRGWASLATTRLGLGLAAVGRPAYIDLGRARDLAGDRSPEALCRRTADLLDAARAAGIGYVDVARSYGRAEEFLARWLHRRGAAAGAITIGSKWGYRYVGDWSLTAAVHEEKELSLARFRVQVEESAAHLGAALDLYQIHSATLDSGCLDDRNLLAAMVDARHAGRYRAIGLTLTGPRSPETLARAIDATVDGEPVFDAVQATFNVLEPSMAEALGRARAAGMGVIAKEVFANGRLSAANDRPRDDTLRRRLATMAARHGATIDGMALAWVLSHPVIDVALSGAATVAQLASHGQATRLRLGADALAELAGLAEPAPHYWATRARLPWT